MATYHITMDGQTANATAQGISMLSNLYLTPATKTFAFVIGNGIDTARRTIVYAGSYPTWAIEYLYDTTIVNELDRQVATYELEPNDLKWSGTWTVPEALDGETMNEIAIYDEDDIMIFYGFPVPARSLIKNDVYNITLKYRPTNNYDELRASVLASVLTNTESPSPCIYIAYGNDDTANIGIETELYGEIGRALATTDIESTYTMNDTVKLIINLDFAAATTIKEIGLFDAASTGNMAFRIVVPVDEQETYAVGESGIIIVKLINKMGTSSY